MGSQNKNRFIGAAVAILLAQSAAAMTVTSQVGTPAATGSDGSGSLTDGWVNTDISWVHTFTPITGEIVSATLTIDLTDADDGRLDVYAGTGTNGVLIGTATGNDNGNGTRGDWQGLEEGSNAIDNVLQLSNSLFSDLQDGVFEVFGDNIGMGAFGSNRALLSIDVIQAIPIPAAIWLFGSSLGLLGWLQSRKS